MNNSPNVEAQHRTMIVIWAALVVSQVMFVVLVLFTRPDLVSSGFTQPLLGDAAAKAGGTPGVIVGFAIGAVTAVIFSFAFRKRLNDRAIAEQNTAHAQTGLIIALALCEASSLFGICLAFAFDYQYFFIWIALGILAMILHFPKRDILYAASMQKPAQK